MFLHPLELFVKPFMHNLCDKVGHVNQICFDETAKGHMHFEGEASGQQMVF